MAAGLWAFFGTTVQVNPPSVCPHLKCAALGAQIWQLPDAPLALSVQQARQTPSSTVRESSKHRLVGNCGHMLMAGRSCLSNCILQDEALPRYKQLLLWCSRQVKGTWSQGPPFLACMLDDVSPCRHRLRPPCSTPPTTSQQAWPGLSTTAPAQTPAWSPLLAGLCCQGASWPAQWVSNTTRVLLA